MGRCLFAKKILNPKYLPSKKNHGKPPICPDERLRYIYTKCGKCSECLKEKRNNWLMRMSEEIRKGTDEQGYKPMFMTLTFGNEYIGVELEKLNWEEQYKVVLPLIAQFMLDIKSHRKPRRRPKHWLISELGETNNRLHFHGVMWITKEEYKKYWKYGIPSDYCCGQYVSDRTINYVTKYVTKYNINDKVKGFKPKTLCTTGMGKAYLKRSDAERRNMFRGDETNTNYKLRNGREIQLPKYIKDKLYTDEEKEAIQLAYIEKGVTYFRNERFNTNTRQGQKEFEDAIRVAKDKESYLKGLTEDKIKKDEAEARRSKDISYADYLKLSVEDRARIENLKIKEYLKIEENEPPF